MLSFPVSVFAKPRGFACAVVIAFVAGTAVGWGAALPSAPEARVAESAWPVKPDFELVFAAVSAPLPKQDRANVASAKPDGTTIASVNFDDVFASFARESRDSTPSRREKLRNAGWRRLQAATQKLPAERVSAGEGQVRVN
ncbi:MAG: hypothetical protein JO000_19120 [Alphaproteobacteria bacterium]|nr:hypothetical protein [Alphaproteobacteria bacterium]